LIAVNQRFKIYLLIYNYKYKFKGILELVTVWVRFNGFASFSSAKSPYSLEESPKDSNDEESDP
jgi:hypothetical protein